MTRLTPDDEILTDPESIIGNGVGGEIRIVIEFLYSIPLFVPGEELCIPPLFQE